MFDKIISWPIPKQYQDVKTRLSFYTAIILAASLILFYFIVLSSEHREIVGKLFLGKIPSPQIIGSGIIFLVFALLGWFMIFLLDIHNKYDRYIVKWRYYYALDFILPTLVRPFTKKLSGRFFTLAKDKNNISDFMKIYYYFVADCDHRISENAIIRFYESITKYWITQINEIILFIFILLTFLYYLICDISEITINPNFIVYPIFFALLLFFINRLYILSVLKNVRERTVDEIEEIHTNYLNELEQKLKELHKKFEINYNGD